MPNLAGKCVLEVLCCRSNLVHVIPLELFIRYRRGSKGGARRGVRPPFFPLIKLTGPLARLRACGARGAPPPFP